MSHGLKHVFEPLDIGPLELRNRLICTGHNPHFDMDNAGLIGDQQTAFHARKAQGGIAMSVTGGTSVHPSGGVLPLAPLVNFDDSVLPGYRQLAQAMHSHGARMLVQLGHASSATRSRNVGQVTWAPSQTIGEHARELPYVMSQQDIETVLDAFYQACARVRKAGLDGVELNFFAGSLHQQFLSPATNRRTDRYGGSTPNRLRFLLETIRVCREALGQDCALTLKLAGDELHEKGLHLDDMRTIVPLIDAVGMIDLYVVASGNNLDRFARVDHWPPTPAPHGIHVRLAEGIKEVTSTPVAALCRIVDPREADRLIAAGSCDLVAMVRATLADPDIVNKAAEDRFDDIRPCVGANRCVDRIIDGYESRCIYNPTLGREGDWGQLALAESPRKVVVIGGGPAGLEASRVAAERGHEVVLFERAPELGGAALVVARKPGREELGKIPAWLSHQVHRHGVEVRLDTAATAEAVLAERPDVVVLATGARDTEPTISADRAAIPIVTARSVLSGAASPGQNVVVVDQFGQDTGCAVAELVADRGGRAEVVSRHFHPAIDFGLTNTISLYRRLFSKGVVLTAHHDLSSVVRDEVTITNCYDPERQERRTADMVVEVTAPTPNDELLDPLRDAGLEVHAIGDCVAPGDIESATFEGQRVAQGI